ncbi:polyribonucleotide nucleotidyltransferase [Raphidocelis subcapitata]|uniref:polyribonucleotide nucleotidyltransferase n=1 Tax=Raphidocelis subcapitata TaxID=307507 RepID=A0A2V0NSP5_9CHLO|nr:polyribonucleotide nucleotidyltransferase [Raphidocelis subcapitata]|eukprot:GBF90656.1 polyribonucleotide nucleotidyltransferase [Raphidocelis subcapitata]
MEVAGKTIVLETGEIGRQANGAVMATMGETVIYTTACCANKPTGDGSFTPLQVHYQERFSAAGRTSGSYLKREGRPKDDDVLVARLVDRPLRPMFAKGWSNDTQVLQWVMSYDGVNQPEPLAITAAAAALLVSDIPLKKAVAGVRVGLLGDNLWVVNPTAAQMAASRLDLVMAGTKDAVLMIEGFCDFLDEGQMLEAVGIGAAAIAGMCADMEAWAARVGKAKRGDRVLLPEGLEERAAELAGAALEEAYRSPVSKEQRGTAVEAARKGAVEAIAASGDFPDVTDIQLQMAFKSVESSVMRGLVLREGRRADGRGVEQIRPITSRASLLPRTHGSALFTRGETQALCVATLGTAADAQKVDGIRSVAAAESTAGGESDDGAGAGGGNGGGGGGGRHEIETFYLQYFFPPSSVGETGRVGPAGVPLKEHVAGIAMGLVLESDGSFVVAGGRSGISAFQMDIKVEGITLAILAAALKQAAAGRAHILQEMAACAPPPRRALSPHAPVISMLRIDRPAPNPPPPRPSPFNPPPPPTRPSPSNSPL